MRRVGRPEHRICRAVAIGHAGAVREDAGTTDDRDDRLLDLTTPAGTRLAVRAFHPEDAHYVTEGFEHLSKESIVNRFFQPHDHLTRRELEYFARTDDHDHFVWIAFDPDSAEPIGGSRYIRLTDPTTAEVAVTVIDPRHDRGVGTLLVRALVPVARANGVETLVAFVRAENKRMRHVFDKLGALWHHDEPGVVRYDWDLSGVTDTDIGGASAEQLVAASRR